MSDQSPADGSAARWRGLVAFVLCFIGMALVMLAALVGWAAFGWRNALLVLAATVGGFFWSFALSEIRRDT